MFLSKENALLLGLDSNDLSIIKSLSKQKLVISELSILSNIPRTSLYYILPRLEQRGFIKKRQEKKKIYWSTEKIEDVQKKYASLFLQNKEITKKNLTVDISKSSALVLNQGNENVIQVFEDIAKMAPHSRFYGIQPEKSIIGAITLNPISEIIKFNRIVNSKKLIAEGIIHEKGTDSMVETLTKKEAEELLKSFSNRSADTASLPAIFLKDTKAEIYLYEDKVAIVNWFEEFGVIIKNKDVFDLIKSMFDSTKYMLKKYDQNEKIARKLVKLNS
ncbi:MAG: hypothetical protein K9M11_00090 [Candidatus Pacebacteria bacterium]|nr:hypothetical protein [Candidatus Paceibacterota bacterium]